MEYKKNKKADVHQLRGMLFSLSLAVTLGLVVMAFEWKSTSENSMIDLTKYDLVTDELLDIPPTVQPPPPPPQAIIPKIVEVPDEEEIMEDVDLLIDVEMKATSDVFKVAAVEEMAKEESDEIFVIVEEQPQFPGGNAEFMKFVVENMRYPRQARTLGIEGKVFIKAVVGKDGKLTDLEVMKGIGGGCDEEAIRVVSQSPPWKPGRQRGREVRTRIVIPLVFKLG